MKSRIRITETELKGLISQCLNEALATTAYKDSGDRQSREAIRVQDKTRQVYDLTSELIHDLMSLEYAESDVASKPNPIFQKLYDFLQFLRSKEFDGYLRNLSNRGAMAKGIMDYDASSLPKTFGRN